MQYFEIKMIVENNIAIKVHNMNIKYSLSSESIVFLNLAAEILKLLQIIKRLVYDINVFGCLDRICRYHLPQKCHHFFLVFKKHIKFGQHIHIFNLLT